MPIVSVIVPTFNRLNYLKEAIHSVFAQTVADWELIVVDDGSTDETVAWLTSLGEPRVIVVPCPHTGRIPVVRNVGLSRATAQWIAFLDSDDRWMPRKLERQIAFHAANPRFRWSYTGRVMIDARGERLPEARFKPWRPHSGRILPQILTLEANIALPSVMAERALLSEVGGFNEDWGLGEDFELWLRLAERCECGLVDEPLLEVRKHRTDTFQRPEVSLGFAAMFESFSKRASDEALGRMARRHAAYHAVNAADRLALQRRWSESRRAVAVALRLEPLSPFPYRAAGRLAGRRILAAVGGSGGRQQ